MTELIPLKEQDYSFLSKGSQLKGEIRLKGISRLACSLEGELFMDDQKTLTIESSGVVKGSLHCHDLEVHGQVEGEINSSGKVTLFPSARVKLHVKAKNLIIYPGAVVNMTAQTTELS